MNRTQWYTMVCKRSFNTICLAILGLLVISCQEKPQQLHSISGAAFGTTYNIKYYHSERMDLTTGIDSVIAAVNQSMSTYWEESDISQINRGDSTLVTDAMFQDVFRLSQRIHNESGGYFDPTIGVLRNAYGFGDTKPLAVIDSITLDSLMTFVGFDKVKLNADGTIYKTHPQIYFDFNAIAKGYGIDKIGEYMEAQGLTNYLVELGGEILAIGTNLNRESAWVAGIETVDSDLNSRGFEAAVKLENIAMAASGNYRKFRVDSATGKQFVHTLNPLTGSAEMSNVTSAAVLARNCAEADAYATTFMALGLARSKELLAKLKGIEVYLTYTSADSTGVYISEGFKSYLKE